jgi:hypothetical protein
MMGDLQLEVGLDLGGRFFFVKFPADDFFRQFSHPVFHGRIPDRRLQTFLVQSGGFLSGQLTLYMKLVEFLLVGLVRTGEATP